MTTGGFLLFRKIGVGAVGGGPPNFSVIPSMSGATNRLRYNHRSRLFAALPLRSPRRLFDLGAGICASSKSNCLYVPSIFDAGDIGVAI